MSKGKSLAELVAELEDPVPKDLDPEEFDPKNQGSGSEDEIDENAGREHYESVSKSKLRESAQPTLGLQYSGTKISRAALDEEEDDDPFAKRDDSDVDKEDDDGPYDDPDDVELDNQDEDDEEIDSNEAFEDGEEELFRKKGFTFKDSGKPAHDLRKAMAVTEEEGIVPDDSLRGDGSDFMTDADSDDLQMDDPEQSDVGSDISQDDSIGGSDLDEDSEVNGSSSEDDESDDEADHITNDALKAMQNVQQKNGSFDLPGSLRSDVVKGQAVKKQYATFDALVGTRVHLQKTLIAANTLPVSRSQDVDAQELARLAKGAEEAALGVFNSLNALVFSLRRPQSKPDLLSIHGKRAFEATLDSSAQETYKAIHSGDRSTKIQRRTTLSKWDYKTQPVKVSSNGLKAKAKDTGMIGALDEYLHNEDKLVQKTRIPRSCAPIQQATGYTNSRPASNGHDHDKMDVDDDPPSNNIPLYDDADFYALLLRELIDHKKSYTSTAMTGITDIALSAATTPSNLLRGNKTKRANVDTKASKGRKMKYTVHEELQNFLAPVDLGTWERRQADELFAGLLGRRVAKLDENEDNVAVASDQEDLDLQGLRLFGSR